MQNLKKIFTEYGLDFDNNKYGIGRRRHTATKVRMPLVHPLVGLSVGDEITVRVPSGEIHMTIQTIEPLQPQE